MKTTISIPDELFREADACAKRRGLTRRKRQREDITARLNEVLAETPNDLDPALRMAQAKTIGPSDW